MLMTRRVEEAVELFKGGFNCSQVVLMSFCEKYGLDKKQALKLGCGLGGGMRSGEACGAVSGAILVIGLKYGQADVEDTVAKSTCYAKTVEFINSFKERNQSIVCRDLLGCDLGKEGEWERATREGAFKKVCPEMIISAIELLEELGY